MKLTKSFLESQTMTARARYLTLEFLDDNKLHHRKDIVEYIRKKEKEFNLEHFRPGCISGGIYQAVNMENCEKIGTATYRLTPLKKENHENKNEISFANSVANVFSDFKEKIAEVSRLVDYVNASDLDCEVLNLMRKSIKEIEKREEEFRALGKKK